MYILNNLIFSNTKDQVWFGKLIISTPPEFLTLGLYLLIKLIPIKLVRYYWES